MVISISSTLCRNREHIAALVVDRRVSAVEAVPLRTRINQMEFVMTVRSMFLASALMAVGGVWAGSANAAPIHADMSLQGSGLVEQVQMHGGGGGGRGPSMGGGGRGPSMGVGRSSGGPGMSFGRSSGSNFSGNRPIGGGNFATNNRPGNWSGGNWNGRRNFSNFRHRGFRNRAFAFGIGPGFYDYGYDYGYDYYPYDDDAYAYVAPGGDSGYCAQRYQSYDPSTGTYLGYDGLRHPCP